MANRRVHYPMPADKNVTLCSMERHDQTDYQNPSIVTRHGALVSPEPSDTTCLKCLGWFHLYGLDHERQGLDGLRALRRRHRR